MVKLSDVQSANAALKSSPPLTAVVVGGTNGIGLAFLKQLAANASSPRIYIVGRTDSALSELISSLTALNPSGTYIPIQNPDLTLVANAHSAATQIASLEESQFPSGGGKIDLLYLSPGYLTFRPRDASPEDLDRITALRYYSRMRIVVDLLPLLSRAPSPRVVTVLGAGQEGTIYADDLGLRDPSHSSALTALGAAAAYTTLFLEQLAERNPGVSFVQTFPGVVKTKAYTRPEHLGPLARFLFKWVMFGLFGWLIATPVDEAGARTLYVATSPEFPPAKEGETSAVAVAGSNGKKGSGAYTVNEKCEVVRNDKVLGPYRAAGLDKKLWEFTMAEFKRILGASAGE